MKQHQIIVWKDYQGTLWYTAQKRSPISKHLSNHWFWSGWKDVKPTNQPTYEQAEDLLQNPYPTHRHMEESKH